jgi:hypothetical protein
MDKAPDFGSGDCRFESCHARLSFTSFRVAISNADNIFLPRYLG